MDANAALLPSQFSTVVSFAEELRIYNNSRLEGHEQSRGRRWLRLLKVVATDINVAPLSTPLSTVVAHPPQRPVR